MRNMLVMITLASLPVPLFAAAVEPITRPPGAETSTKTSVLKAGAAVLQTNNPLEPMHVYLSGFHVMKDDPAHQLGAHHFCSQVNEDFAQCALFDGNARNANLTGVEYIISEALFNGLPADEKKYWHPHNYEILSGQLAGPGLPDVAEKALMKGKMNSYGKTWHFWNTDTPQRKGDPLPFGDPALAWSFNRDGEARPGLVESRDKAMKIDSAKTRSRRAELQQLAHPQTGVDAMHGKFPGPTQPLRGVTDAQATATRGGTGQPGASPAAQQSSGAAPR